MHKGIPALSNINNFYANQEELLGVSCFEIRSTINNEDKTILGTLLSLDGMYPTSTINRKSFIISKSSLVGENAYVIINSNKRMPLKVISRDEKNDLVLCSLNGNLKNGIKLKSASTDTLIFNDLGMFLISPTPHDSGEVSVIGTMQFELNRKSRSGFLGTYAGLKDEKVIITKLQPNSPALDAKLETGDKILSINDKPIIIPGDIFNETVNSNPGDKIIVKVQRQDRWQVKTFRMRRSGI